MQNDPNFKHYTRGGQISFHNFRMWDQITKTLTLLCLFLWLVFTGLISWFSSSYERLTQALDYYVATFFNLIGFKHSFHVPFHGKIYTQSEIQIVNYPYYAANANEVVRVIGTSSLAAFFIAFVAGVLFTFYFIKRGKRQSESQFIRGAQIRSKEEVMNRIIADCRNSDITIDGFPLLKDSEVQHVLIHGTVGTGKSQLIMKILDGLRKRGDRVIIYDKGGAFIQTYFDELRDVILNPFDARCPNWDMWQEAPRDSDFENVAESLIPMHGESDPFWVNAARTVFASAAIKMRHDKERSLGKLLNLLLTSEFNMLENYVQGTPAATLVSGKIEKTAISIRSVITTYLKSLQTLVGVGEGKDTSFSIREYLLGHQNQGWLFISSFGEQHKSLKPLMSMWLAMASLVLLSLEPDRNRRIWFFCDELPSLHKLPLLCETIAEVRKFGGCFVLGMQSHSQLVKVYGQAGAKELFDLLNTRFFFRSPSSDMAKLVSQELGEEDIEESRENYSYGANSIRDGISLGNQRVSRLLVSPPEIMELEDLTCFVKLPGPYPITKLSLSLEERKKLADGFIERPHARFIGNHSNSSKLEEDEPAGLKDIHFKELAKGEETLLDFMD